MLLVKLAHVGFVLMSLTGFVVRGYWMWRGSERLRRRWVRVLPHVVDTLLLATGVTLAVGLAMNPLRHPWLAAKLVALVAYIMLGSMALKRGRTRRVRGLALVAALGAFAYMLGVALTHDPLVLSGSG